MKNKRIRKSIVASLVSAVVACGGVGAFALTAGAATPNHHTHVQSTAQGGRVENVSLNEADLAALAQPAAAASGDATPRLIQHVAATRQLATDVRQGGDV